MNRAIGNKICSRCGIEKPFEQFAKDRRKPNGIAYACRECEGKRHSAFWQSAGVKQRVAVQARKRYWDCPDLGRKRRSEYRREHVETSAFDRDPFKESARRELREAVRSGRVIKPTECQECGSTGTIHGHHDNYARALDVDWLCLRCHGLRHRKYVSDEIKGVSHG